MFGISTRIFHSKIFVFHFHAYFQLLTWEDDWGNEALSSSPFATAITGIFFFKESVQRPFEPAAEFLGQQ